MTSFKTSSQSERERGGCQRKKERKKAMVKEAVVILVVGLIAVIEAKKSQAVAAEPWDRLLVTWKRFEGLPLTATDAKKQGWTKDACCGDPNNQFYGNRYVKGNDTSTRLLYGNNGELAGIQATITADDKLMPSGKARPSIFIPDDNGNFLLNAYFSDPLRLCRGKVNRSARAEDQSELEEDDDNEREDDEEEDEEVLNYGKADEEQFDNSGQPSRNMLWFQMAGRHCKPRFMKIPLFEKELAGTKWVKGKCMTTMGVHYWYDIFQDMDCVDFFPVFLLYSKQNEQLQAFGWALPAALKSPRWEHPPVQYLPYFFEEVPKCFKALDIRSTQHIYRSNFAKLKCD